MSICSCSAENIYFQCCVTDKNVSVQDGSPGLHVLLGHETQEVGFGTLLLPQPPSQDFGTYWQIALICISEFHGSAVRDEQQCAEEGGL